MQHTLTQATRERQASSINQAIPKREVMNTLAR